MRGTEVALYDYARYAEELLGHSPVILAVNGPPHPEDSLEVRQKFTRRFETVFVDSIDEIDRDLERRRVDLLYKLKHLKADRWVSQVVPTAVHEVFRSRVSQAVGDHYAYVSPWLARYASGGAVAAVPHIVSVASPTSDLRKQLGIPASATVFGGYGGQTSFDIPGAKRAVARLLEGRKDAYFVSMNFTPFVAHERAFFLPGSAAVQDKANLIAATDAMLHARRRGETFGLACGEFSLLNKPVITFAGSNERSHIEVLGDKAVLYSTEPELDRILSDFDRVEMSRQNWDTYSADYAAVPVMKQFDSVFIKGQQPIKRYGASARATVFMQRMQMFARQSANRRNGLLL